MTTHTWTTLGYLIRHATDRVSHWLEGRSVGYRYWWATDTLYQRPCGRFASGYDLRTGKHYRGVTSLYQNTARTMHEAQRRESREIRADMVAGKTGATRRHARTRMLRGLTDEYQRYTRYGYRGSLGLVAADVRRLLGGEVQWYPVDVEGGGTS